MGGDEVHEGEGEVGFAAQDAPELVDAEVGASGEFGGGHAGLVCPDVGFDGLGELVLGDGSGQERLVGFRPGAFPAHWFGAPELVVVRVVAEPVAGFG